jgi:hypothetical protein
MVKSYIAKQATQDELADLIQEVGSAERLAGIVNRGRRGTKRISGKQLRKMSRAEPVRISESDKRAVQRLTSRQTVSSKRSQIDRTVERKDATLTNIENKKQRLQAERAGALRAGLMTRVNELDDEIARLDEFRDDIKSAARNVETYDDYRNIADKATP